MERAFTIARRAVRRICAYTTPEYGPGYKPTGRMEWARRALSITEVDGRLAAWMTEQGITSRKVRGAIRGHLRAAYASLRPTPEPVIYTRLERAKPRNPALMRRLHDRLIARAVRHAPRLPAGADNAGWAVIDRDPRQCLALVSASWWYEYSRRAGSRKHQVQILCGREDGQEWARRVPYPCASVGQALAYVRPAAVNDALTEGREVKRQGDVWLVRLKSGRTNLDVLRGTNHEIDGDGLLRHPEHGTVDLSAGAWRAYLSKDTTRASQTSARHD